MPTSLNRGSIPNVRASSGMIGTTRLPSVWSRSRFRMRRVNAIVVEAAALPEPLANSANAVSAGAPSGFARMTRRGVTQPIAEGAELVEGELLRLVRDVARLHARPERPALHGLREDRRRRAGVADRGVVRRVHLAVVVTAAPQLLEIRVGQMLDELA